jgi:hypothetical protein
MDFISSFNGQYVTSRPLNRCVNIGSGCFMINVTSSSPVGNYSASSLREGDASASEKQTASSQSTGNEDVVVRISEEGIAASTSGDSKTNEAETSGNASSRETDPNKTGSSENSELTEEEKKEIQQLEDRDQEVRTHEQAHIAAGGQYVRSGASFEYQTGPDGEKYAVGGEVSIDVSKVPKDPQATISKMQTVIRAAMAPASPSGQDRAVAAKASRIQMEARAESMAMNQAEAGKTENPSEAQATEQGSEANSATMDSAKPSSSINLYI